MSFPVYPKIKQYGVDETKDIFSNLEDEIIIEEKIDGANFRFIIKDKKIIFGSRTRSIGDSEQDIGGNWRRCVEFIKKNIDLDHASEGVIYFGECCVKHSIDYVWNKIPPFLGFDILDLKTNQFLSYDDKCDLFKKINLPIIPLIQREKVKFLRPISEELIPNSVYSLDKAEGIVIKNYSKGIFAKYVTSKFKEINKETFGDRFVEEDYLKLVFKYCTNARIEKNIFKLLDEGNKLEMSLMKYLPNKVLSDIFEECYKDIFSSNYTIDFKSFRKKCTQRCLVILNQFITNNMLNSKESDLNEEHSRTTAEFRL